MANRRAERIASAVQQEVARLLLTDVKDPRVGVISITGVKMNDAIIFPDDYFPSAVYGVNDPVLGNYLTSTFSRLIPDVRRLSSLGWSAQVTPTQGFRRMIEAHTP